MELSIEEFELMEAYFNGELAESQKEAFEQRIQTDPGFREEVLIQAKIREGLRSLASRNRDSENLEIKEEIAAAGKRYHASSQPAFRPFSLAASVLIVLCLGWVYRVQYYIPEDARATAKMMQSTKTRSVPPALDNTNSRAEWEKALAIIAGQGKKSEAKKILKRIAADSSHPQQENAKRLLEKL